MCICMIVYNSVKVLENINLFSAECLGIEVKLADHTVKNGHCYKKASMSGKSEVRKQIFFKAFF